MMLEITSQILHLKILVHLNIYNSVFSKPQQACTFLLSYPLRLLQPLLKLNTLVPLELDETFFSSC